MSIARGVPAPSYPEDSVQFMGETVTTASMDSEEVSIFNEQLNLLVGGPTSVEGQLFQGRREAILIGLRAIKYKLDKPKFKGFYAQDNELSWRLIRPKDVAAGGTYASPTVKTTWAHTLTTSYADWLYSAASTAFNLGNIDKKYGLIVVGIKSPLTAAVIPQVAEVTFKLDRRQSIIFDIRGLRLTDNINQVPIVPIPTQLALPESDVYGKIIGDAAQTEEVALSGVTVGLGRFLKTE